MAKNKTEETVEKTPKKVAKTATLIREMSNYVGEVTVYELSAPVNKGGSQAKFVVVSKYRPHSGLKNTNIFPADENGVLIEGSKPLVNISADNHADALKQIGFKLV